MDKKLIFGIIIGFGSFYLFEKMGKKDCGCNGGESLKTEVLEDTNAGEGEKETTCKEAVAEIMNEVRKNANMSESAFAQREAQELALCKKMSKN